MTFRLAAPLVLAILPFIQLQPQTMQAGFGQARVVKNVRAEREDVPVIGPIDASMDTAVVARNIRTEEDTAYINLKAATSTATKRQTGIALAGRSAVLAAGKLAGPKPESLDIGESIFLLESQRTP